MNYLMIIKKWMEEKKEGDKIIGGDFNARTEREGGQGKKRGTIGQERRKVEIQKTER